MRDHASLRNQLWFLLLRFFRDVIIIFSDCDGIKSFKCESSLWRLFWCICRSYILLWWKDIFKIVHSYVHVFFPMNALTQRARSSARDSFWKDFTSISKKNHHRDRRKFYVNERRRAYFGPSDRAWFIERRDPWHYQGRYMSSFALQIFRRRIVL